MSRAHGPGGSNAGARIAGTAVALAVAVGLVHGSQVPLRSASEADAILRIAWSARPERIEVCRTPSAAELEALPAHMRQSTICEGAAARYHLEVRRDGQVIATAELHGGGLRGDRQLYIFREIRIPSGASDIAVRMVREDSTAVVDPASVPDSTERGDRGDRAADDIARSRRLAEMVPARLELRERVTLAPREVLLVTYDPSARQLRTARRDP
jgi:hypothetical protein